ADALASSWTPLPRATKMLGHSAGDRRTPDPETGPMALVPCPECEWNVSSKAKVCPQCGYPLAEEGVQATPSGPAPTAPDTADKKKAMKPEDFVGKTFLIETGSGNR